MKQVRLRDGHHLAYEDRGAGPTALLLHGFTGSSKAWGSDLVEELCSELRVIAVDLMGHGESSKPHQAARYAIEEQVQDLSELLQALECERALWVGYSMGGRIALAGGVLRPDKVEALILEGASPGLQLAEDRTARRRNDENLAQGLERDGIEPFVDGWTALPLFESQKRLPAEVRDSLRTRRLQNDPVALAASLRGCGTGTQPSFWDPLRELPRPTLLLAGEQDSKFRQLGGDMAARIPRAELVTIDGAGHTTHLERPQSFSHEVRSFARSLQGS